jgi:hypothetical protein
MLGVHAERQAYLPCAPCSPVLESTGLFCYSEKLAEVVTSQLVADF